MSLFYIMSMFEERKHAYVEGVSVYQALVGEFAIITEGTGVSGRCCDVVSPDGVPECCQKILDGEELTFTSSEIAFGRIPFMTQREDGMFVLDRRRWSYRKIKMSLKEGLLARTLECASHPTRPVVQDGKVVDVVVIDGCNSKLNFNKYVVFYEQLVKLWQIAVDRYGMKPYYGEVGRLKPSWKSLKSE